MTELWVCDLGRIDYRSALAMQEEVRAARQAELIPDTLLLLEHAPAVYTRGRRSAPGELSMGEAWYAERGIEIIDVNRGGKITYHGPGQLVGYPIVRVADVVAYVRLLERSLVAALSEVGVAARARVEDGPDYTGVWVQNRKIASIGVHVQSGVTTHGFAINVIDQALEPFTWVVACGLPEVQMTSVESERRLALAAAAGQPAGEPGTASQRGGGPARPAAAAITLESFAPLARDALAAELGHDQTRAVTPDELTAVHA